MMKIAKSPLLPMPCPPAAHPPSDQPPQGPRRASGAALVISLILMLVLTVLGIGAAMSTSLQGRMSANMADRNVALQAAEYGARAGEAQLQAWINSVSPVLAYDENAKGTWNAPGVYIVDETADYQPWELSQAKWDSTDSIDAGAVGVSGTTLPVAKTPRYMITVWPTNVNAQQVALEGVEQGGLPTMIGRRYTVTAVGWGTQDSSRAKIQIEYYSPF